MLGVYGGIAGLMEGDVRELQWMDVNGCVCVCMYVCVCVCALCATTTHGRNASLVLVVHQSNYVVMITVTVMKLLSLFSSC